MSGIAGIFQRDGRPVERGAMDAMLAAMEKRGPDGRNTWFSGQVGLGSLSFWTTPEAHLALQPLEEQGCVLVTDARLDQRAELRGLLRLSGRPLGDLSDAHLILAAYLRWGPNCVDYLSGDFAFAIWDDRKKQIFCVRDRFGVRPFYYYLDDRVFIFASDLPGVLANPAVPQEIDDVRVASHFFPETMFDDKVRTFFLKVLRMPPAHILEVQADITRLYRYWHLNPRSETYLDSDEAYAAGLREIFCEAVSNRLHSRGRVGSTLSGGLDSSSIVCTARAILEQEGRLPLDTYSAVFDQVPSADERSYINAVIAGGGLQPHYTHPDCISPLVDIDKILEHFGEPFYSENYFIPLSLCQAARGDGIRVMLEGTEGDSTISHGFDRLASLLRRGQWAMFASEAQTITQRYANPRYATVSGIFRMHGGTYLARLARQGKWIAFVRHIHRAGPAFGLSRRSLIWEYGAKVRLPQSLRQTWRRLHGRNGIHPMFPDFLNADFARRTDLPARLEDLSLRSVNLPEHDRAYHHRDLESGALTYSLEMMNRMGSLFGVEYRFPFCDHRLATYALSLPPEQKLSDGWSRWVMRRAMEGLLPPEVQWRGGKGTLARVFPRGVKMFAGADLDRVLSTGNGAICEFVDLSIFQETYGRYLRTGDEADLHWVWAVATLNHWLQIREESKTIRKSA